MCQPADCGARGFHPPSRSVDILTPSPASSKSKRTTGISEMDPLSITVSIVTFIGLGGKAFKFGRRVAGARCEIEQMLDEKEEVEFWLDKLIGIVSKIPSELQQLLNSWNVIHKYRRKITATVEKIDRLVSEMKLTVLIEQPSALRRMGASIRWSIQSKRNRAHALLSELACLKGALLSDHLTTALQEVIEQWVTSKDRSRSMEARMYAS